MLLLQFCLIDACTAYDNRNGKIGRIYVFITCSAMILDADWSIGVRSGAVHPLQIQYHTAEFNTTTSRTNSIRYHHPDRLEVTRFNQKNNNK